MTLAGNSVTQASRGLRVPTETAADDAANAARKQVVLEDKSGWSWSWNDPITGWRQADCFWVGELGAIISNYCSKTIVA